MLTLLSLYFMSPDCYIFVILNSGIISYDKIRVCVQSFFINNTAFRVARSCGIDHISRANLGCSFRYDSSSHDSTPICMTLYPLFTASAATLMGYDELIQLTFRRRVITQVVASIKKQHTGICHVKHEHFILRFSNYYLYYWFFKFYALRDLYTTKTVAYKYMFTRGYCKPRVVNVEWISLQYCW